MVLWLADSRVWYKNMICKGTLQLLKNTKHEFLHGKVVKEPIKILNIFYARNVIEALFLLNSFKNVKS